MWKTKQPHNGPQIKRQNFGGEMSRKMLKEGKRLFLV